MLFLILMPVVLFLLAFFGIAVAVYGSVLGMSDPDRVLKPATRELYSREFELAKEHHTWASDQGFAIVGGFVFQGAAKIFVAAWQLNRVPTFFCLYRAAQNTNYDFVTVFPDGRSLTTASTKDAALLPRPTGAYLQAFPGRSASELWRLHEEALSFLSSAKGLVPEPTEKPFREILVDALAQQIAYVRSLPLWPFRGMFWYFVRREVLVNRSVAQQLS